LYNLNQMSKAKKEVELLLENLQKGVAKYSIKQVNDTLVGLINGGDDLIDIDKVVIQEVAKHYNLSPATLLNSKARKNITDARHIAYNILHHHYGLSIRDIANRFNCWHSAVHIGIKRYENLDTNLEMDRIFTDKYSIILDNVKAVKPLQV
jgi:chromosomal replication initiation ATPase DnaA